MTCSRTSPSRRLVIVAAVPEAADRASVDAEPASGAKRAADGLVDGLAVGVLARQLWHHGFHHLAHVLDGAGAGFSDRRRDGAVDLLLRGRRRQIFLKH